jgi:hypothetical protein
VVAYGIHTRLVPDHAAGIAGLPGFPLTVARASNIALSLDATILDV